MKIVLKVTRAELIQLLCKATNSAVTDFSVIKVPTVKDVITPIMIQMGRIMNLPIVHPDIAPSADKKIPYIKALRECVTGLGLAEAKWAVENWVQYTTFIRANGRLPKFGGSYNEFRLI